MRSCVIDIGSNTIRAVVYGIIGERFVREFNKGVKSMLFANTTDGNLSAEGMAELSSAIAELRHMTEQFECEYYAFATSAFRDLKNQDEVIAYINESNGIKIKVLSGEEEVECDYLGLQFETGAVRGVGVDLGGGSCQLMAFSEEGLSQAVSLPLGCARLRRKFVDGELPTREETQKLYDYVKEKLSVFNSDGAKSLFLMGGTARAALEIKRVLLADKSRQDRLSKKELEDFVEFAYGAGAVSFLKAVTGKRYNTVIVGIIAFIAIADYVGAESVIVKDCSVRDGYVRKYLMR